MGRFFNPSRVRLVYISYVSLQSSFMSSEKNIASKHTLFHFLTSYYLIIHANSLCAIFPDEDVRMSTRSASRLRDEEEKKKEEEDDDDMEVEDEDIYGTNDDK